MENQTSNVSSKNEKYQAYPKVHLLCNKNKYHENPEARIKYQIGRYQENSEKQTDYQKTRYEATPEIQSECRKTRYQENSVIRREYQKIGYQESPDIHKKYRKERHLNYQENKRCDKAENLLQQVKQEPHYIFKICHRILYQCSIRLFKHEKYHILIADLYHPVKSFDEKV